MYIWARSGGRFVCSIVGNWERERESLLIFRPNRLLEVCCTYTFWVFPFWAPVAHKHRQCNLFFFFFFFFLLSFVFSGMWRRRRRKRRRRGACALKARTRLSFLFWEKKRILLLLRLFNRSVLNDSLHTAQSKPPVGIYKTFSVIQCTLIDRHTHGLK